MTEMLKHIFGDLERDNRNIECIKRVIRKQSTFNRNMSIIMLSITIHMLYSEFKIIQLQKNIEKIEEMNEKKGD